MQRRSGTSGVEAECKRTRKNFDLVKIQRNLGNNDAERTLL